MYSTSKSPYLFIEYVIIFDFIIIKIEYQKGTRNKFVRIPLISSFNILILSEFKKFKSFVVFKHGVNGPLVGEQKKRIALHILYLLDLIDTL